MTFFARTRIVQAGAIAAAALLAAGAAAPVQAAANDQQQAQTQASPNANSDRRICVRMEMPSTRLARRVCRTQAEWDRQGGVPASD